jgi:hypothetical protein
MTSRIAPITVPMTSEGILAPERTPVHSTQPPSAVWTNNSATTTCQLRKRSIAAASGALGSRPE